MNLLEIVAPLMCMALLVAVVVTVVLAVRGGSAGR
jgi:hypothetical protein